LRELIIVGYNPFTYKMITDLDIQFDVDDFIFVDIKIANMSI